MFCLYIHPSVRIEQLDSRLTDFHDIWYSIFFENLSEDLSLIKIGQDYPVLYMKSNVQF
jgi:hypothetical protein